MNKEIKEILNEKFEHLKSINEIKFLNDLNQNDLQNKKKDFLEKTLSQSGNFVTKNDGISFQNYFVKEEENFEKECSQLKNVIEDNYITQNKKNNKIEELHKLYEEKVNKIIQYVEIKNNSKYLEELLKNNILSIENVEASNNLRMQKKMNKILEREVLRLRDNFENNQNFNSEDLNEGDDFDDYEEDEEEEDDDYSSSDDIYLDEKNDENFKFDHKNDKDLNKINYKDFNKINIDDLDKKEFVRKNNFLKDKSFSEDNDSQEKKKNQIIKKNFLKNKSVKSRKRILNEIIKSRKSKLSIDSKISSNSNQSNNSKKIKFKKKKEFFVPKNNIFNSSKFSNERNPELLKKMMSVDNEKNNTIISSRSVKLKKKLLKKNNIFKDNISKSKSKNLKKKQNNFSEKNIFFDKDIENSFTKEKNKILFDNKIKQVLKKRKSKTPKNRIFKGFGNYNKLSKTQNSKSTNKNKKERISRKSFNQTNSSKITYSNLFKKDKNFKKLISEKILKSSKEIYNKKKKDKSSKIFKPRNFTGKKIFEKKQNNLKNKDKIQKKENGKNINKIKIEKKNDDRNDKFNINNIVYDKKLEDRKVSLEKIENKYNFEKNLKLKIENKNIENSERDKNEKKDKLKKGESKISLFLSKINNPKEFEAYTKKHKIINYRQNTKIYKNYDLNKAIYSDKEIMEELSFSDQFILDLLKISKKDSISLIPPKSSFLMDYSKPSFIKNVKNENIEKIEVSDNFFDVKKNSDIFKDKQFLEKNNLENSNNGEILKKNYQNLKKKEISENHDKIRNTDLTKKMIKKNNYFQKDKTNFSKKIKNDKLHKIENDEKISEGNFFDKNFMVESNLKR